ncbi:MAG: hypothetical protein AAF986_02740 [Pseudomonadota bacterium]
MPLRLFISLLVLFMGTGLATNTLASGPTPPSLKPAAPESPWISTKDKRTLRGVFEALSDRDYTTANALRAVVRDPVVRSVADWAYLRSNAKAITAEDIGQFLDRHYEWPNETLLRRKAEKTFDEDTPSKKFSDFLKSAIR